MNQTTYRILFLFLLFFQAFKTNATFDLRDLLDDFADGVREIGRDIKRELDESREEERKKKAIIDGERGVLQGFKNQAESLEANKMYSPYNLRPLFPLDKLTDETKSLFANITMPRQYHSTTTLGVVVDHGYWEANIFFTNEQLKTFKQTINDNVDSAIAKIDAREAAEKEKKLKDEESLRRMGEKGVGAFADGLKGTMKATAKGQQDRENAAQMFNLVTRQLKDPHFVAGGILATIAIVGGGKLAFDASTLMIKRVQHALEQPNIISASTMPKNPWEAFKRIIFGREQEPSRLDEFEAPTKELGEELPRLINSIRNAVDAKVDLPNLLFYGPPGTGKTMYAEILAKESGKEYACLSGANFTKCTPDQAVQKIEELALWARGLDEGAIIFIDEAEIAFTDRTYPEATELSKAITNKFLELFPKPNDPKLMFIFASNNYGVLDVAIDSRIDKALNFVVPPLEAKLKMLSKYLSKEDISLDDIATSRLLELKSVFDPLVGRDIEAVAKNIARNVNANGGAFSFEMLKDALIQKQKKKMFSSKERLHYQKNRFGRELDSSVSTAAPAA